MLQIGTPFWNHIIIDTVVTCMLNNRVKWLPIQPMLITLKAPNTTIAEFANTVDPDETAHNELSHLYLQCLPSIV